MLARTTTLLARVAKQTFRILLFLLASCALPPAQAAPQASIALVADLNTGPNRITRGSMDIGATAQFFDGKTFLTLRNTESGRELWTTDGTPQNTRLFADICPGACDSAPFNFYVEGNALYFSANDGRHGSELWRLTAGTTTPVMVADIEPGPRGSSPGGFVRRSFRIAATTINRTFFAASRSSEGRELWRLTHNSNAAATTVALELDIAAGTASSSPNNITLLNTQQVGLLAQTLNGGRELHALNYSSTTAPATSSTVFAALGASSNRFLRELTTLASNTYVLLEDASNLRDELWVTQGTEASTILLRSNAGRRSMNSLNLNVAAFRVFFVSSGNLAVTDGTPAGTTLITSNNPGASKLMNFGNRVAFLGTSGSAGRELLISDGTSAGTGLLKELVPGSAGIPSDAIVGETSDNARWLIGFSNQLWTSDGTSAGTLQIASAQFPGAGAMQTIAPTRPNEAILGYFPDTGDNSSEPFFTQSVANTTVSLGNIYADVGDSFVEPGAEINQRLIFRAESFGSSNIQFSMNSNGSGPLEPMPLSAYGPGAGIHFGKLWIAGFGDLLVTDGTAAGTTDISTVSSSNENPDCIITRNGARYFLGYAANDLDDSEIYKSDGTLAGTVPVTDLSTAEVQNIFPYFCFQDLQSLASVGNELYFAGKLGNTGTELLKLNANDQVSLVADVRSGTPSSGPLNLIALSDRVLFTANDGVFGTELWSSRGNAQTTERISDINPGTNATQFEGFRRIGNRILFIARNPATGHELYVSDGTAAGTQLVKDLFVGPGDGLLLGNNSFATLHAAPNNTVVFSGQSSDDPDCVVFVSDGTAAGTQCAYDSSSLKFGPVLQNLTVTQGGAIVFAATLQGAGDGQEMRVIFQRQLLPITGGDIAPGPAHSGPSLFLTNEDHVFFQADNGETGRELWRLDLANLQELFRNSFE